ncbi:MAG: helix-turn-helix transcriptional regulator [Clostridia bacterium]|nr:helix-turn-helix transcriptional regulator [Clostridia bacterium]
MLTRIKLLRQERGLSQRALADLLGISQQSINKYENHNIEPDISMLQQIADLFGVSIDYLVERTDVRLHPILSDTTAAALTCAECQLVDNYRQLSPDEQLSIDLVIRNYLASKA